MLYLEVPDATTMLAETGIYDVIYEHCSYFGAPALQALVNRCGLEVLDVRSTFGRSVPVGRGSSRRAWRSGSA
ncbi:MAG: hypothetical protein M5U19_00675 [Microthrixaceae bacterium]|nr:hypothetical protein [Microthrixaceae bacterium]